MGIKELIVMQFIAHLLLDFFFQTNKSALIKNAKGFRSGFLYLHAFLCFVLSWIFSLQVDFVLAALAIAVLHLLIDGIKPLLGMIRKLNPYLFYLDQFLHLTVLVFVVYLFDRWVGINPSFDIQLDFKILLTIACYLVCLKPTNILIREVFKSTEIQVSSDNEMPNAGKVIGTLERILTLTFILVGQYSAVGFLIAAKSILRYRSDETLKSEYVLIGTLLSFGVAVLLGILISSLP